MPGTPRFLQSSRVLSVWILFVAGVCGPSGIARSEPLPQDSQQKPPVITATPNPVIAASGQGTTIIEWQCSSPEAQVYMSPDGGPEQLFSGGMRGRQEASWILEGRPLPKGEAKRRGVFVALAWWADRILRSLPRLPHTPILA